MLPASSPQGTPQGGVISPLLSNIYLHVLDWQWQQRYAHLGRLVRYADDYVILCRRYQDALESRAAVQALALRILADRLEHKEALPEELVNLSFIAA